MHGKDRNMNMVLYRAFYTHHPLQVIWPYVSLPIPSVHQVLQVDMAQGSTNYMYIKVNASHVIWQLSAWEISPNFDTCKIYTSIRQGKTSIPQGIPLMQAREEHESSLEHQGHSLADIDRNSCHYFTMGFCFIKFLWSMGSQRYYDTYRYSTQTR